MINENKIIEKLNRLESIVNCYRDDTRQVCLNMICEIKDFVNEQPKVGEWISVKDRLPERYKNVLVYWRRYMSDDCYIDILFMNENNEFLNDFRKINGVPLAWMPLPEPFKG